MDLSNAPSDHEISTLADLGQELFDAEADVLRCKAALKRASKRYDAISLELPETMREIGCEEFKGPNFHFKIRDVLVVRPLKDNRPLVLRKLEEWKEGGNIKTMLTVQFAKGEDAAVKAAKNALLEAVGRTASEERNVHSSTLKRIVKERLEKGEEVDMDLFGVKRFDRAVFTDGAPDPTVFDGE